MLGNNNLSSRYSAAMFAFLLFIIFTLPIPLGSNRPWAWNLFQIFIFALSFSTVLSMRHQIPEVLSKYSKILYLWLAFMLIALIQFIPLPKSLVEYISPVAFAIQTTSGATSYQFSLDPGQSLISFIKLLSFFCLFLATLFLVNSEKRLRGVFLTMLAAGTFQALYGSLEVLLQIEQSWIFNIKTEGIATGSFVYKNHYANFLMMCLAAGIGLLVTSLEKDAGRSPKDMMRSLANTLLSSKALYRICLAIMVIGLVMSRSRMGNTAFFMAMTITGLLALVLIKNRTKGLSLLVISMFIIDLMIVSAYFGLDNVKDRLGETSLAQESRDEVIVDALPMLSDFSLVGSGAGSFYSVFPSYQKADILAFYDHTHNDYLQFAIEYGWLGFGILLTMASFALYKALRAMRRRKRSIFKGASFACIMVFIGMAIHTTVDFPLQAYANASYFVIFIALSMLINSLKLRRRT